MIANARRKLSAPLLAAMLLALAGCTSSIDVLPEKMGGLPESAPARPAESYAFPNVYEVRPTREAKPLSDDEQKKLETDLVTLREQQKNLANPPPPPPPPPAPAKKTAAPAKPAKKAPSKTAATKKQKEAVVPEQKAAAPLKPIN
jgi:outer membrane biosynthesis protein TonB